MSVFFRAWRRVYQVATDLSNVLSCCHLGGGDFGLRAKLMFGKSTHFVLDTVFPVVGCRELIPDNYEVQWMISSNSYLITIVMPPAMQPLKLIIPPTLEETRVKS